MTLDILALLPAGLDAFGLLGMSFGVTASLQRRRSAVLLLAAAAGTCFGLHFLRLGSATGAAMCMVSVLQNLASARFVTAAGRPGWLTAAFMASALVSLGLTFATWAGPASALCGLGSLLSTCARLQGRTGPMRRLFIGASACWAGHDFLAGSVPSLTCDLLSLTGYAVAMRREAVARRAASQSVERWTGSPATA